jgi:prepilin-type N-terminal cleavage/methylation domain-containing protein
VRKRERPAFTLVELMVVITLITVLATILTPVLMGCGGLRDTTLCQNHLGVIGRKYNDYANGSGTLRDPFPRHIDYGDAHDITAGGLRVGSTLDDDPVTGIGTCGMQTVWVLIARGDFTDNAFKCPGDAGWTARPSDVTGTNRYGWSAATEFSYGIHYPYSGNGADNPADPNARHTTLARRLLYKENLVLFADRNPGGAVDGTTVVHTNHGGPEGGCIVVARAGNTKFFQCAANSVAGFGDDIYTDEGNTAKPVPDSTTDTVITPQASR